ncbi:MAG TPA: PAS domain-containing protein [Chroococcidiopsis sp.]
MTQQKQAEQALRQSEEHLRLGLAAARMGIWEWDIPSGKVVWSGGVHSLFGLAPGEFGGTFEAFLKLVDPQDLERVGREIDEALKMPNRNYYSELRVRWTDGSTHWLEARGEVRRDSRGEPLSMLGTVVDVTERKQTEAALRHSEATNRAIINAIPDLLIRVSRQGEYLEMLSGGSVQTILLPELSVYPNTVHDVLPPRLAEQRADAVEQAFVTRSLQVYEQLIDLSGEARWEEVRVMPLGEEEVLVMIRDISERKWAEETMTRSESKKRAILSAIPDLMFQVSAEGVYLDYITTERAIDIVPTTINSIGLKMSDVLPPEVAQRQQAAIQRALDSQQLQVYEQQFEMGDRIQYEEVRVVPAEDNTVLFMIRDISDRKRAELALYQLNQELEARIEQRTAELRASEERWHLALRGSDASLWDWNLVTDEIFRSTRWHELRGLSNAEVSMEPWEWSERIHPEDRDRVSAAFADHLAQKTPFYQEEYRIQRKDGTYVWILDRGQALWDETGKAVRMTGSEMDISRRKQVELEAQILRERLQFVLSSSPAVIFTCAIDGAHEPTFISDNIFNLIGYTSEEFLRDPSLWMTHIHPQDAPRVFAEMPTLFEQGTHVCEYRLRHRDSHYCWVRNELKLVFDQGGDPVEIVGYLADINDRKQLELALQASQSKLSNVLNSANAGIIGSRLYRDRKFEYDFCSQGCETVFGYGQRELMGDKKLWISRVWPDDLPLITAWFNNILTGAEPISCDYRFFHQDGTLRWITSTYTAYWNDLEDCWIVTAVHVDITARKRTEEALAEKTEALDLFFNVSLDLLSITDSTGCFRRLNPQWEATLGYALEEVEGQPFLDFVHPDDFAATVAAATALAQQMPIVDFVNRYRCKDGSYRWIEWRSNPFGSFIYSAARDVTERKQTEAILQQQEEELQCIVEELQVTEEELRSQMTALLAARDQIELERSRYQDLFDSAPDAYVVTDAEGQIQQANQIAEQLLGSSRQSLTGQWLLSFVKRDSLDLFQHHLKKLISQAESQQFESELQRADGTTISAVMRVAVLSSPGHDTILRWIIRDISHEKQAEAQLQSLSERLSLAIRSGAIGIWEWDIIRDMLLWDDRMYELYGVQRSDFEGAYQAWLSGLHPDDRPLADAAIQHALTGQHEFDIEFRVIHPNGAIRFIKAYGIVQRNPEGIPQRMIGINFDITERKQVEVQLQQINNRLTLTNAELDRATRLKDEFLANMSHELRTPLNAILGMSEGLKEGVFEPISDRQRHAIDTIERSGQHLLELINDILDLSKIEAGKLELQKSPVLVSYLCDSSLSFIRQQALQKSIHLVADIPKGLPDILIDERRIRQVLINLLSNAIKFTPEGGRIQLIAKIVAEASTEGTTDSTTGGDRRFLELSVVDTGIGIAPDDLSKLFQPFVQIDSSLSRQYTGTGLGLALVRRLAELHDGSIDVTSEVGQGSCFTLRLPYISSIVTDGVQRRASEPSRMPSNNSRVLLIEDSIAAADQLARYLEEQGMAILVYGRGEGALEEVIRIQPGLVILDIQLPNLSGWDVLQQLKTHPDTQAIPVVMVSVVDERSRGLALGAADYLVKPITREQLRTVLGHLQHPSAATATATATASSPESAAAPRASSGRNTAEILPLILLVEDNEMNIATISSYLGGLGYRLVYAKTGYEALAQIEAHQPDLVLMDIQMPDMDGLEAMRQIRQNPAWAHLPIVALTALTMPGDRDRCLEAGATSYLPKPIKLKLLKEQIWQLLNA